jgi:hypothetical protein
LAVSLIFFETDLNLLAVAGCAFMVLAIIIFSLGKKGASPAEKSPRLTFKMDCCSSLHLSSPG